MKPSSHHIYSFTVMAEHQRLFHPESPRGHKIYAWIFIVIMVFRIPIGAEILQAAGNVNSDAGNLQGTDSITSMVSQVWGYNGTVWTAATNTLNPSAETVTAAFPTGFAVKQVIVVTANASYNNEKLLENSLIYSTSKVTITVASGMTSTLNAAYAYIGNFHNASATSKQSDKSVMDYLINDTIYSGSTNNLGTPIEYNVLEMFASPMDATPMYQLFLHTDGTTGSVSIAFQNYLSYPFHFNLINTMAYTEFVVFFLSLVTVIFSVPKTREA